MQDIKEVDEDLSDDVMHEERKEIDSQKVLPARAKHKIKEDSENHIIENEEPKPVFKR